MWFISVLGEDGTRLFSAVVAGDEVDQKKPAPDVYLKVLDLLGFPSRDCLAIEDSRNGLLAASRARIPVLITRSAYFYEEEFYGAFSIIESLAELVSFDVPVELN